MDKILNNSLEPNNNYSVAAITSPSLQIRKLKHRQYLQVTPLKNGRISHL